MANFIQSPLLILQNKNYPLTSPIYLLQIRLIIFRMQGYLQLWQGFLSRWTKYYFRIHQELLIYGPTRQQIQGRIHLKVAQIISKLDDPITILVNTGTETIYLRAYSIDEKVKWYKKLKQTQKSVEEVTQNKQLFKLKMELSKINRFKILDDLNTELWKCHAELEQRLQQVILKTKNVMITKNIDRLRMTIDQFKYKTSQILQYIDQQIRDLKTKQQRKQTQSKYSNIKQKKSQIANKFSQIIENQPQDGTVYYSFYSQDKEQPHFNKNYLHKIEEQSFNSNSSVSLDILLNKNKESKSSKEKFNQSNNRQIQYAVVEQKNKIKYKLLNQNKVFSKIGNIFSKSQTRKTLPQRYVFQQNFPILKTISGALTNTDTTRSNYPISTYQPMSDLQHGCEQMYYSQLLSKADESNDENIRILYISAFIVSTFSLLYHRLKRPFHSILGETFQYIDETRGFQFLSEQVSINPSISAFYARSNNYQLFDNNKSQVQFSGNSIKIKPQSISLIKLEKFQDYYSYNKCIVSLNNILMGKVNLQLYGKIIIKCKLYNTTVQLYFPQDSIWNSESFKIHGFLQNNGKKLYTLGGAWNSQFYAEKIESKQRMHLWKKYHPVLHEYYNFNDLSIQLNHLSLKNCKNLPPTDSRFRPDQRALEYRLMQLAQQQKNRILQKQKSKLRQMEKSKVQYKPLWFKHTILQGEDIYISNDKYWGEKIKGDWKESLDLF